jgi:hypothetical protein
MIETAQKMCQFNNIMPPILCIKYKKKSKINSTVALTYLTVTEFLTLPTFCRNILPPPSALKIEAACSSKTLVSAYKSTLHCNPEDQHQHLHCH